MVHIQSNSKSAFTLVEILIALVILALLMTAVAVALDAAMINYNTNETMFKAMNTARQALMRITTELRTASIVGLIGIDDPDNQRCSLIALDAADNIIKNITYRYDNTDNTLYLDDNLTSSSYALCENVTAATFDRATVADDPAKIRNVQISLTVTIDDISQTVSAAAVIRKNMK